MTVKDSKVGKIDVSELFPPVEGASTLELRCVPADYSAAMICRAVEDCDAHVLNLNVAADRTPAGELRVLVRVDMSSPSPILRSLSRFGFEAEIIEAPDDSADVTQARERANELLRYLEI